MILVEMQFPHLAEKLRAARGAIQRELVVSMQTNRGMLFDSEGAYNGHTPWASLTLRAGQILAQRGVLKKSIAPAGPSGSPGPGGYVNMDDGGTITMGTNVAYAGLMNYGTKSMPGGVMRPVHAKVLAIPLPEGRSATPAAKELGKGVRRTPNKRTQKDQKFIFRKFVRIPERRFDTVTNQDAAEFASAAQAALVEALQ